MTTAAADPGSQAVELCAHAFHGQTFASLRAQKQAATNDTDRVASDPEHLHQVHDVLCHECSGT